MYFFDILDYYIYEGGEWLDVGLSGSVVGCGGGPLPADWEELFSTARATRDAFKKMTSQWFVLTASSGYTENLDQGCSPTYLDLWVDMSVKLTEYEKYLVVLSKTIYLYRFNYYYSLPTQSSYPTYEDYYLNKGKI
jgi:hypothetical protein